MCEEFEVTDDQPGYDAGYLRGPDYVPDGKLNFPIFLVRNRLKFPSAFSYFLYFHTFCLCHKI